MLKFRCQHCGQRVAVPARNLGKLVTCSECGMQTHPLAEQIVAAAPATRPTLPPPPAAAAPRHCDNCGTAIGRLEAVHAWNDHLICGACHGRLATEPRPVAAVVTRSPLTASAAGRYAAQVMPEPRFLDVRERVLRALVVFLVAAVALYGALTLLRDIAGLVAVAAVAVLALLSLYALFRGTIAARRRATTSTELAPLRTNVG
jgi:predicted RNA-binding Zn-ribbon protein involved in translation (DUF1610 family)